MTSLKLRARQTTGAVLWRAGLTRPRRRTLTVLMYHAVTGARFDDPGQMNVSAADFERQLDEIRDTGIPVVDLLEGVTALTTGAIAGPSIAIVFDDGFVGVHDFAAPMLQRRGFPATVFVTTSWVGRDEMALADRRLGRPMTWRELEHVARTGITIGNHTATHARLSRVDLQTARLEIAVARDAIAARIGRVPDTFAYPFGSYGSIGDAGVRQVLTEEGVRVACTTVCGRNVPGTDPLAMRRIRVSWCDREGEIRKALAGCYDWYRWVQRLQTRSAGP
jgi:peptidoglycan/xylan/chitin deacetylase (PgdA/CDA1 family)